MCHSRPLIPVIPHKVATLSMPLFIYVFGIFQHLLIFLSLYPYKLIDWWWCHHGSILPLYGRGKVVYEHVFGGKHYIEGGLVSPRKAPSSLGRLVAVLTLSPLVSGSNRMKNEETGGGDIHRYSMPPLFNCSIVVCMLPQRPGQALEQKESMTAWWYAVIIIIRPGDN